MMNRLWSPTFRLLASRSFIDALYSAPPTSPSRLLTTVFDTLVSHKEYSLFSRFRPKRGATQEEQETHEKKGPDSEAFKQWLEGIKDYEHYDLIKSDASSTAITRIEARRMKKRAFLHAIETYLQRHGKNRRGFNQFILNALEQMSVYEVTDDLDCYKAIIRIFPTGRMVVTTFLQAEIGHFQRQQTTMIQILQQMARHHVLPDDEVGQMVINVFGWRSHAMQHYRHMMYWVPKLRNINPWPVALRIIDDLEENPEKLARLIAERICPDRMTEYTVVRISDSKQARDKPTSMISAQSPEQRALLSYCTKPGRHTIPIIYLDGPNFVWYRTLQAAYYTLWTELDQPRLNKEKLRADRRESIRSHTDFSDLPLLGHSVPGLDTSLDQVAETPSLPVSSVNLPANRTMNSLPVKLTAPDPSGALVKSINGQLAKQEPEFDNRWLALRQSHVYSFLPGELTAHEQAEGSILAIGVVTPIPDALIHQKQLFDWEVSKSLKYDSPASREANEPTELPPKLPTVPRHAPPALLRQWLSELRKQNPHLDRATLVIRVSEKETEALTDTEDEDKASTNKSFKQFSSSPL
ncbi:unnamed protein product [Calicophoron daubneyi]|uniref:ECSIT N-terminal domain-containing protein n=1 Tax=Calicophoron daubneyi TaxID=300641 RepID=A0AAV2TGN4_CALDB